jgi:hypothetical protein
MGCGVLRFGEIGDIWLSRPNVDSVTQSFLASCGFDDHGKVAMIRKLAVLAVTLSCSLRIAASIEPVSPSPEEVARAYIAARDVGNIDAALAFFTSTAIFQLTGGKKFTTPEELRRLHELFAREHVHTADLRTVSANDHTVTLTNNVSTAWLTQFGLTGMLVYEILQVDGSQITSLIAYYPVSSLLKMEQVCHDNPQVLMPTRPCGEVMPFLRAHTERLIAEGIARKE